MKTQQISRRALAAGLALAPVAGLAGAATPAKIYEMIDAHRSANRAFERAIDDLQRFTDAYEEANGDGFQVPCLLGGGMGSSNGYEECKRHFKSAYETNRRNMRCLSNIAPELAEKALAAFDFKEIENMALIDELFAEEAARREKFGLAEAERRWEETSEADSVAALALCSYQCQTLEEARIRAEYIMQASIIHEDEGEYFSALLRSFMPGGDGDRAEG
jgi:hypothetical protein